MYSKYKAVQRKKGPTHKRMIVHDWLRPLKENFHPRKKIRTGTIFDLFYSSLPFVSSFGRVWGPLLWIYYNARINQKNSLIQGQGKYSFQLSLSRVSLIRFLLPFQYSSLYSLFMSVWSEKKSIFMLRVQRSGKKYSKWEKISHVHHKKIYSSVM